MIHPFVFVLNALLISSAVLGGHLPAAALIMYTVLFRGPKNSLPISVLVIIIVFAFLQLISTLVVNLVAHFVPGARAAVFVGDNRILTESFGIYEAGTGSKGWIFAGACIPSALLLLYIFFFQKKLLRHVSVGRVRPRLVTLSWIFMNMATALLVPTVLACFLLLIGMVSVVSIEFIAGGLFFKKNLNFASFPYYVFNICSFCGVFVTCIVLVATCVSQNAAIVYATSGLDPMYGLTRLYDQSVVVAICSYLQVILMMFTLFLTQIVLECYGFGRRHANTARSCLFFRGSIGGDQTGKSAACQYTSVPNQYQGDCDDDGIANDETAIEAARAVAQQQQPQQWRLSGRSMSVFSGSVITTNCCERIMFLFLYTGTLFLRLLFSGSRFIPLALMAVNMVVFPTVVSLSLLPTMMIGQLLMRKSFARLLRWTLSFFFPLVFLQYVVFATKAVQPAIIQRLFLSANGRWFGLAQVICSELLFLVLSAADVVNSYRTFFKQLPKKVFFLCYNQEQNVAECCERNADLAAPWGDDEGSSQDETNTDFVCRIRSVSLGMRRSAECWLGAERVAELLSYVPCDSVNNFEEFEQLFFSLVCRKPTVKEKQLLCKSGIGDAILVEKMQNCQKHLFVIYMYWLRIFFTRHVVMISLFLLFFVGSFTYHMDILHVVLLVAFALHFFFPSILYEYWRFMLAYLMLLTSVELLFTFASDFFVLPVYIAGSPLQYATVGLVPLRSRYEAIPYIVAVFVIAFLFQHFSLCRSWEIAVSLHEWDLFFCSATARRWLLRLTMIVATGVFVGLGVFLDISLVVDGFLALFLLLTIVAAFKGLSSSLLWILWYIASAYSGVVLVFASACQFIQLSDLLVKYVFGHFCGDKNTSINTFGSVVHTKSECWRDIGLYPSDNDVPLTFFLAPWFLAFATTMTHIAAGHKKAVEPLLLLEHNEQGTDGVIGNEGEWQQEEREKTEKEGDDKEKEVNEGVLGGVTLERGSFLLFNGRDQRFFRHVIRLVAAMNLAGSWISAFGADYGGMLVWVVLGFASIFHYNLMNAVYILFFVFDLTHISVLVYCVLHIFAIYTYQFSFIPAISYDIAGVPFGNLIGLQKYRGVLHSRFVIVPIVVFFTMLLRIHTCGANDSVRRRQRAEGPESSNLRSVLCTQLFFYAGYEALVLTLLIVCACAADSCSGAAVGLALLLLLAAGRSRFYFASCYIPVFCLVLLSLAWQYFLHFNWAQGLFPFDKDYFPSAVWHKWVFKRHFDALVGCFVGIMLLHTNRQQANETAASFSMLRAKHCGHITLSNLVRDAGVKSLQRLPRDTFDRVVPCFVESLPPSCLGRVTRLVIFLLSSFNPVAICSFILGVITKPSVINLVLVCGGLVQVAQFDALRWRFFSLWSYIAGAYYLLIFLSIMCNAPYVQQLLKYNIGVSEAVGVVCDGQIIQLNALQVILLFFVALQTRVYSEFRFAMVIRRLYCRSYTRHIRYEEMQACLRAKNMAEKELVLEKHRALQRKLNEIRLTLPNVNGNWTGEVSFDEVHAGTVSNWRQPEENDTSLATKSLEPVVTFSAPAAPHSGIKEHVDVDDNVTLYLFDKIEVESDVEPLLQPPVGSARRGRLIFIRDAVYNAATRVADWLAANTHEPHRYTETDYMNIYTRFFWVTIRVLENHTMLITLIMTMINFMLTSCIWELLPFCIILVIANAYKPFPPRFLYVMLTFYVAFGIMLKIFIGVLLVRLPPSPCVLDILSWTIIHVSNEGYWRRRFGYSYVIMDFVVYATLLAHQNICLARGVYSQEDILLSREGEWSAEVFETIQNSFFSFVPAGLSLYLKKKFCGDGGETEKNEWEGSEKDDSGQSISPVVYNSNRREFAAKKKNKLILCVFDFLQNAISTPGIGRDWYIYYFIVDILALIIFVFFFNDISGVSSSTLQESVRRNLLPGAMVIVVLMSFILLLVDRMLYVRRCMKGKFLLNTISGVLYCVFYLLWRHLVDTRSCMLGNVYFVLKIIALWIAVWQVRVGYPQHRRHDPFTCTEGRSVIMSLLYQIYRAVPFLWEIRVVTDWAVEHTSLSFIEYLKIEDLYDIIFVRQSRIHDAYTHQPKLGTAIRFVTKIFSGFLYLAICLIVLIGPLLYYSTFSPLIGTNDVTRLHFGISFLTSRSLYESTAFVSESYPLKWPLWLTRTRPSLIKQDFLSTMKSLQLMRLGSCSSELWTISPQALRGLIHDLTDVVENNTRMELFQLLEISRASGSGSVTNTMRWTISRDVALDLLTVIQSEHTNTSKYVLLRNFYSPFVFIHEDGINVYSNTEGRNIMDCSIHLRTETDVLLNTTVRYWCFKCNALFTKGNIPTNDTTLFPEWGCLSTGEGCKKYNMEWRNGDIDYNPVNPYFVLLSDPSVSKASFFEGIGIIALYTTFVLAVARLFRGMFANEAKHTILYDMADPTPVAQLINYIALARESGDLRLEQAVYFELVDLLRSPERLLRLTGLSRQMYDAETDVLQRPPAFSNARADSGVLRRGELFETPVEVDCNVKNDIAHNGGERNNEGENYDRER